MKKITIAEPCHENWADFTPTQRGAFCGTCQINVIDFSQKSNQEIKTILNLNAGKKMCGKFKTTQLDSFNSEYHHWQNQNNSTFQSKFIFALVLGFGLTLFSCTSQIEQDVIGKIQTQIVNIDTNKQVSLIETVDTTSLIETAAPITAPTLIKIPEIMGDICVESYQEEDLLGEMVIEEIPITTKGEIAINDTTPLPKPLEQKYQPMIMGKFVMPKHNVIENNESKTQQTEIVLADQFEASAYPNPTKGIVKLDLNSLTRNNYHIYITDNNGKVIKSIFENQLETIKESFSIDLSDQANGLYFIVIKTKTESSSIKIFKI